MVKIVDNYVLQRVIGKGQFGQVYKGYNKVTMQDVAIKTVNRKALKGKFYELLENEIKVLRTCDNINIIKLYDIKKTSNNIYLMLEYCNEGDLMQYMKKKKKLSEEEAVEILVQILNAFKTLIKNNIMHRDFKLPNVLKHNGIIKIADFGFSKMLGEDSFATTMLGSPLNMAPEILGGKDYNNKADIWSIGTCFYEMLFEKPPYTAKNIMELLQKIKANPMKLSSNTSVSPQVRDLLERMLIFDPKKRIDWNELFNHPVTRMHEEQIKKDLESTMKNQDIQNISRFYINNNKVIDHPEEIERKRDINNFAYEASKHQQQTFNGKVMNRKQYRNIDKENFEMEKSSEKRKRSQTIKEETTDNKETQREKRIRIFKANTARLLHERNKYVFLASVAEEAISFGFQYSDLIAYLLIKKLFKMLCVLKKCLENQDNLFQLDMWQSYIQSKDFKKIGNFIFKEFELFQTYFENLNRNIEKKSYDKKNQNQIQIKKLLKADSSQQITDVLKELLQNYIDQIFNDNSVKEYNKKRKEVWVHINQLLDCLNSDKVFYFDETKNKQFNFKLFYQEVKERQIKTLAKDVQYKMSTENLVLNLQIIQLNKFVQFCQSIIYLHNV